MLFFKKMRTIFYKAVCYFYIAIRLLLYGLQPLKAGS